MSASARVVFSLRKLVLLVYVFVLLRFVFVIGLVQPVRVQSGSMAPAFFGPRCHTHCAQCGETIVCGIDGSEKREVLTCPGCGFSGNPRARANVLPGERVLIVRSAFFACVFRRFEPIVFQNDGAARTWSLKRIVAFPGETVDFHEGNLRIDGSVFRKSLEQQRLLAVEYRYGRWTDTSDEERFRLSFSTARFVPWGKIPARFQGKEFQGGGSTELRETTEWDSSGKRFPGPHGFVPDRNMYNQLCPEHSLPQETDEILLCFPWSRRDAFGLSFVTKIETLYLELTGRELHVLRNDEPFADCVFPEDDSDAVQNFTISVIDRQLLLAHENRVLFSAPLPQCSDVGFAPPKDALITFSSPKNRYERGETPFFFHVEKKLFHDPYISSPRRTWFVPENGYFVLGDNYSISQDSRFWQQPFVPEMRIIGKPVRFRLR